MGYDEDEFPTERTLANRHKTKWNAKKKRFNGGDFKFDSRHQAYSHIEGKWKVLRAIQVQGLHNKDRKSNTRMYLTFVMRWYVLNGVSNNEELIEKHIEEYNLFCDQLGHPERKVEIQSPEWVMSRGAKPFFDRFFS